ncbi:YdcF family protein [Nonomuraea sp. NPDC059023]|uniref:YdcF family protein n=1 Tax=unclassified Nonomuraea TaxID=2593643 RepID=UPI0036A1D070
MSSTASGRAISDEARELAALIWDYHRMRHRPEPCDAAIGLGGHDLGVVDTAVDLYRAGLFPVMVFSGGASRSSRERFPRGEAVHFRERAIDLGMPADAILLEPDASNTGENIAHSRRVLAGAGCIPSKVLLISMPCMERRGYATARRLWPEAEFVCASSRVEFDDYLKLFGDERFVLDMLVGDLQRVMEYPKLGFAIEQDIPQDVRDAYEALVRAGYDGSLISS